MFSCSSKKVFYDAMGSGVNPDINGFFGWNRPIDKPHTTGVEAARSDMARKYLNEKNYVDALQEKINQGKDCEENEKKLKEMSDQLIASCKERVLNRINLLRAFYTDLPNLSEDAFISKYKKHCSRGLLKELKKSSVANGLNDAYNFTLFINSTRYNPAELKYYYENKDIFFKEKPKEKYELFPFYNAENKWIKVENDGDEIWVKVDGEGKHIAIVGLVNQSKNIKIITQYDR